jgi:hypothetical protein
MNQLVNQLLPEPVSEWTICMKQSKPWETNSCSDSQIPCLLWNPNRVHNIAPLDPVPGQINPLFTVTNYLFKISFNRVL